MSILKRSLLIATLGIMSLACSKDKTIHIDDSIVCTSNAQNHTSADAFQSLLDQNTMNGFVGITALVDHPTDGLWTGASGYANIETNTLMQPCHIHHAASIYKTFIATIIMQLVEEGKLSLADKLANYLSTDITNKLPNGNSISIKNLLQHRTGIPDIFEAEFLDDFFLNPTKQYTIRELLEYVYDKPPLSNVDTKFHYSDANFSLLTLIIQQIDGDFVQSLQNRIFKPLALENTYFLEHGDPLPAGLVNNYWDRLGNGNFENNTDIQIALTTGLRGSEGIITNANDLKTFIKALANGELVTNISQMTDFLKLPDDVMNREVYSGYGMGFMKVQISGKEWFGHFGNQIGAGSIMLYNAEKGITVIILTNTGTFFSDDMKVKFYFQLLNDFEAILF